MNALGWGLGLTLGLTMAYSDWMWSWIPASLVVPEIVLYAAGGFATGIVVGLGQWLGWGDRQIDLARWLVLSGVGGVLAYLAAYGTFPILRVLDFGMGFDIPPLPGQFNFIGYMLGGPLSGLVVGVSISLLQSRDLAQKIPPLKWIAISALAATMGFLFGTFISLPAESLLIVASVVGLVSGFVSGFVWAIWVPKQPRAPAGQE